MGEFTILFDADRQLFEITITGAWNIENARTYHKTIVARASRSDRFDMIVDIQATTVLPTDAAREIEATIVDLARLGLRRSAHVTSSALAAIQVRRIGSSHTVMAFFCTRAAALDWLASADQGPDNQDIRR